MTNPVSGARSAEKAPAQERALQHAVDVFHATHHTREERIVVVEPDVWELRGIRRSISASSAGVMTVARQSCLSSRIVAAVAAPGAVNRTIATTCPGVCRIRRAERGYPDKRAAPLNRRSAGTRACLANAHNASPPALSWLL
ncbi:MAG: hypothetical protein ACREMA_14175 [Longimicrobiales bacterium]